MITKLASQGTSTERHAWLEAARLALLPLFKAHDATVPTAVRVTVGWPKGARGAHVIGQCFGPMASADGHAEVFISPELGHSSDIKTDMQDTSTQILGVLAHELVHATVGIEAGHKAPFKRVAVAIGLEGKMTATVPSDRFHDWCKPFLAKHGPFPGAKLTHSKRLIQTTRLLKAECPTCGYVARVTAKWVNLSGAPVCPTDGSTFECT